MARFSRVVTFDKRGQGLSDRLADVPSLEDRIDDVRAVMDAIGSRRAVLVGFSEDAAMSVLFATTYPDRIPHLVLFGGLASIADLFPPSFSPAEADEWLTNLVKRWGSGSFLANVFASEASNPDAAAKMAAGIPGAKYIEYPSGDHAFWTGDTETLVGDIEEFVTGHRQAGDTDLERILATVMFTDIVDSTRQAAEMGDQRWRGRLDEHDALARQFIDRHRGNLVKTTGDGVLATFDGPGRAIRCALSFSSAARQIGLPVRAGLHTGEIEMRGGDIGGIAVHAVARVMSQSGPDEVLVSRVVTDLVAGAGLRFSERGSYELKGLPGKWDLFAATG
ncbi:MULTISPECIES: adenylate/guanylate cyclase domain-containing protein [unclassified Bradyrhizobium]|uniref:adenylate/guanylate cyclase domain-containing protein n=1 Tax=unclassified Bradyrhizobium TaxID=2631580 RepID=UPI003393DD5A